MSLSQTFLEIDDLHQLIDDSIFTQNIPIERVESALTLSIQATIRRDRMPSDRVLWLVIGMALFCNEPTHEVAYRLSVYAKGFANDAPCLFNECILSCHGGYTNQSLP
ncbi:MAG: hypothetical protein ISEC1_P1267 [Thiomicrorhabdus sp.]|nr:MAG: hypothetical protein ISEC1_P1267 [Thiomicrorhabdus sp.]